MGSTKYHYLPSKNTKDLTFSIKNLELDSNLLGIKVGKIESFEVLKNSSGLAEKFQEFLKDLGFKYLTIRVDMNNMQAIHFLESLGFKVIDVYLSLFKENDQLLPVTLPLDYQIKAAEKNDILVLQKNIAKTFKYSRFFTDPLIPYKIAVKMHQIWIENCFKGMASDYMYVLKHKGKAVGFITLEKNKKNKKEGHIVLVGIDPKYKGKKLGGALISFSLNNYFRDNKAELIKIETQAKNIPALRSYQSLGFKIENSSVTLRWAV